LHRRLGEHIVWLKSLDAVAWHEPRRKNADCFFKRSAEEPMSRPAIFPDHPLHTIAMDYPQ
jgi:hypothetical protein